MNGLEARIRAATRARGDEITPDQIQPLDLAGAGAARRPGPGRGRGSRAGGGRRRWVAPVAAAAAVGLITAVVAGVAADRGRPSVAAGGGRSGPARPAVTHGLSPAAAARLDNQVLGMFVAATGPQYTAGMRLEGTILARQKADTAGCLARHGVRARVPAVSLMAGQFANNYVDNSQFPDLTRISRTQVFVPDTYLVQLRPAAGQRVAFRRWFGPCQAAATARFAALLAAGQRLDGAAWGALMARAPTAGPVRATLAGLRACAAGYGWPSNPYGPPATAIRSFGDFADWVFGHLDGAGSRGASAATMRGLDRHWSVIFVRCGRATLAAQDRWLAAQQARFVRQHAAQVRAADALARRALGRDG